jgi:hypothetical protein
MHRGSAPQPVVILNEVKDPSEIVAAHHESQFEKSVEPPLTPHLTKTLAPPVRSAAPTLGDAATAHVVISNEVRNLSENARHP